MEGDSEVKTHLCPKEQGADCDTANSSQLHLQRESARVATPGPPTAVDDNQLVLLTNGTSTTPNNLRARATAPSIGISRRFGYVKFDEIPENGRYENYRPKQSSRGEGTICTRQDNGSASIIIIKDHNTKVIREALQAGSQLDLPQQDLLWENSAQPSQPARKKCQDPHASRKYNPEIHMLARTHTYT